jgi:sarcosine oxidase
VVLLEQFEQGHGRGSSHGATRIFRFAYPIPEYVRMAQAALPLWRELEDDAGDVLLETTGGLDIGDPLTLAPIEDALRLAGAEVEYLAGSDATDRWPGIRPAPGEAVLFSPDSGRLWADRTVAALQRRAAAHGADVRFEEPVRTVSEGGVTTDEEEYEAAAVVVAAGAWVAGLLDRSDTTIKLPPLTITREQSFHFAPRPGYRFDDDELDDIGDVEQWPSFIHYRRDDPAIYGLGTPGEGVKVAEHHTGAETDPDHRSFAVDEIGRQRVVRYVTASLPGLDPTPVTELTCLYTTTPDGDFILERHGDVVVGSACSGHGFKFTPLIGRRLADLAAPATATPTATATRF